MLGLGVRTAAIRNLHRQGSLTNTSNQFDLALNGRGWFQVNAPSGETVYTRAGSFNKNGDGQLVTLDGYTLNPPIIIPANTLDVTINESGEVFAKVDGQAQPQNLGQLTLANFATMSAWSRSAATTTARPSHPVRRLSAFRPTQGSARFTRVILKLPTSIRLRRSQI